MIEYTVQSKNHEEYYVHKWDGGDMPITSYTVLARNGQLSCNCPSGVYRHRCKHTSYVRDYRRRERQSEPIESLMKLSYQGDKQ